MTEDDQLLGRNLTINKDRLCQFDGNGPHWPRCCGGNNRQALTDADAEGRDLFKRWCVAAGLTVKTDKMGSMFARRDGTDPDLPPVMVGSHLTHSLPAANMTDRLGC